MGAEMINRDIKDFTTVSSVDPSDYVVLSLFKGISGKVSVALFRSVVAKGITPSISGDGYWLIGDQDTQVPAKGMTPEFRKGAVAVEWRYTTEDDTAWRPLLGFSELRMRYEDLTEEQISSLKLKYEDLTEEDIAELQQPSYDMIAKLEQTDSLVQEAETLRVEAEAGRASAEEGRVLAETERAAAEDSRKASELGRAVQEEGRRNAELARKEEFSRMKAESESAAGYAVSQGDYAKLQGDYAKSQGDMVERDFGPRIEALEQKDIVLSEDDYSRIQDSGKVDNTKFYFVFEE